MLAATLLHAATLAARHVSHWEVVDYGYGRQAGRAERHLAGARRAPGRGAPAEPAEHDADVIGPPEARGASVAGTRVHSLRLPGYALSTDVVLATPDERLVVRHEAGASADPYVAGTLLAVRRVSEVTGVLRGLDRLLFG